MRLASFLSEDGRIAVGVLVEGPARPLLAELSAAQRRLGGSETLPSDMRELLVCGETALDAVRRLHAGLTQAASTRGGTEALIDDRVATPLDRVTFMPVVPRPGKMICAGKNYADHVAEAADERPERPAAFAKFSSSLLGHEQPIRYPKETRQLDYEGELAIVIGRPASHVGRETALDHVAGYTIFNDVSSRDVQFAEMPAGMLLLGKNAAAASPLGPWLVTADEVADPHDLSLEVSVNGAPRQSGHTSDLLFDCADLVSYWSTMGLEPGDVIATGTPSGVGIFFGDPPERYLLKPGDVVEVTISGLGTLRNAIAPPG